MYKTIKSLFPRLFFSLSLTSLFLFPTLAFATQTHGEPEGLFVHQAAHFFFLISMGVFSYWLRARKLTESKGWRYIRYAAFLLMAWNIDAALVHFLDEQLYALSIKNIDHLHIQLISIEGYKFLGILYYILKLDHLWCVPALVLLYLGIRHLSKEIEPIQKMEDSL